MRHQTHPQPRKGRQGLSGECLLNSHGHGIGVGGTCKDSEAAVAFASGPNRGTSVLLHRTLDRNIMAGPLLAQGIGIVLPRARMPCYVTSMKSNVTVSGRQIGHG